VSATELLTVLFNATIAVWAVAAVMSLGMSLSRGVCTRWRICLDG
jgi:hypothetical protein